MNLKESNNERWMYKLLMKSDSSARKETGREPWWKLPPKSGQKDEDLEWGYLITYDNGDMMIGINNQETNVSNKGVEAIS